MAHLRTTKFGAGRRTRPPERTLQEVTPTRGLHVGKPQYKLPAGYTPDSRNFVAETDAITPRSGLSLFAGGDPGIGAVIGGDEVFDEDGNPYVVALSDQTVAFLGWPAPSWSTLSNLGAAPSGNTQAYWDVSWIYNPATQQNMTIMANGIDTPKFFYVGPGAGTYSDFTFMSDIAARFKTVIAADERLVMANCYTAGDGKRPQRVAWSVRGNPTNQTLTLGAGFVDLTEMRGDIIRVINEGEGYLVFTDHEIWRARPRRRLRLRLLRAESGGNLPIPADHRSNSGRRHVRGAGL
jgi:hypothetical protein